MKRPVSASNLKTMFLYTAAPLPNDDGNAQHRSATNIPSACRIANIALNDAMILPYGANLGRMEFSERTGVPGNKENAGKLR